MGEAKIDFENFLINSKTLRHLEDSTLHSLYDYLQIKDLMNNDIRLYIPIN